MNYAVLFAIVWWKADIWWAIASVVAGPLKKKIARPLALDVQRAYRLEE